MLKKIIFLLFLFFTFNNICYANLKNNIAVDFQSVNDIHWPLEKGIKQKITIKNIGNSESFIQVDALPENEDDAHVTIFPQPCFLLLKPGEKKEIISIIEYSKKYNVNPGTYTFKVDYNIANHYDMQDNFSVDYSYTFEKLKNIDGNFSIKGVITDEKGNPIKDAEIRVSCETCDSFSKDYNSDAIGNFTIPSLPERNDWYMEISKDQYKTAYFFNLKNNSDMQITLQSLPKPSLPLFEISKYYNFDIGFWKQSPTKLGDKILVCQGMENWPSTTDKSKAKIFLYSMKGDLLWEHSMGGEAWGSDLSQNGTYAVYVVNGEPDKLVLLDGKSGNELWEKTLTSANFSYPDSPFAVMDKIHSLEVELSHGEDKIALGEQNGAVFMLNIKDGSQIWAKFLGLGQVRKIIFDKNDKYIYAGNGDGYLYKLNAATGEIIWKAYIESWPYTYGLALSPDESYIAAGTKSGMLTVLKTDTGKILWNKYMGIMNVRWVQFSPDGKLLAAGSGAPLGTMMFKALTGTPLWKTTFSAVGGFTHDGKHLMLADYQVYFHSDDGTLELSLDPDIKTVYWKVGYIDPSLTYMVVGARDLTKNQRALVFYKAKYNYPIRMWFTPVDKNYQTSDIFELNLCENSVVENFNENIDIYIAIVTETGKVYFLTDSGQHIVPWNGDLIKSSYKFESKIFKNSCDKVLSFKVPDSVKGKYTIFGLVNMHDAPISDGSLLSNIVEGNYYFNK